VQCNLVIGMVTVFGHRVSCVCSALVAMTSGLLVARECRAGLPKH
jgi:hypothetical protein